MQFAAMILAGAMLAVSPVHAADAAHPVVIELYQSQGCSSCPPANANVNALIAARPDVLALSFAVTYWDQLGWKDGFATPANTQRQWDYAKGLGHDQVWTPQVIVNGRADTVGSRSGEIEKLLASAAYPANAPAVTLTDSTASVGAAAARKADVWLVRYDPRTLNVPVKAGENEGRTLPHRNIVKQLVKLGSWSGTPAAFRLPPAAPGLATAILVQAEGGGPILAAARG